MIRKINFLAKISLTIQPRGGRWDGESGDDVNMCFGRNENEIGVTVRSRVLFDVNGEGFGNGFTICWFRACEEPR
ncbi:unnamed protein product [Lathyrus sativus]|nr:unnamed protein product [Lathyrus sativus]